MISSMNLTDNSVHLWFTQLSAVPASAIVGYQNLLNPADQERNQRFKNGKLRDANTVTRALLRTVLSQYDDCPPHRWEFGAREHGKPYIASPASGLHFNLSHSVEWIVCAVSRIPVIGVDVERCGREVDVLRLAKRFFSEREYLDVMQCAPEDRKHRFFDYWTLKEAYIKARGEGISLGLDKFSFGFSSHGAISIECDEQLQENAGAWHFRVSPREGDHRLALAVKPGQATHAIDVRYFTTIPQLDVGPYAGPMRLQEPEQAT